MSCDILMVSGVADADGYPCGRGSIAECSDCGSRLCQLHSERCDLCRETYCSVCLGFHVAGHSKPSSAVSVEAERRRA